MAKKLRKPRKFGVRDEIHQVTFDVDKTDLVLKVNGFLSLDDKFDYLALEAETVRWLSNELGKVADYLESTT